MPIKVVTSAGEPVVGVILTALDELQPSASPRGCGPSQVTPTDSAGQCTFFNLTPGHFYSVWLQGYPGTGSGEAGLATTTTYQPIILQVTGRQVAPPSAHGGGSGLTGKTITSSGEEIPGIGVCASAGSANAGVNCVVSDAHGNYSAHGCCDVRVIGSLVDQGGSYVNGSVRHAPAGVDATLVVRVNGAPVAAPSAAPSSRPPSVPPPSRVLAQTGKLSGSIPLIVLGLIMFVAGLLVQTTRIATPARQAGDFPRVTYSPIAPPMRRRWRRNVYVGSASRRVR